MAASSAVPAVEELHIDIPIDGELCQVSLSLPYLDSDYSLSSAACVIANRVGSSGLPVYLQGDLELMLAEHLSNVRQVC